MKPVLIGSRALNYHNPDVPIKDSTDFDVISDEPIPLCEYHDPDILLNRGIAEKYVTDDFILVGNTKVYIMSLLGLSLIKRSHLHRDLSFQKHITHYHKYLKDVEYDEEALWLLRERTKATKIMFPEVTPKLNVTKQEFFNDGVKTRVFDHDLLHELVRFYEEPLYVRLQNPEDEIWCHKDKWDALSPIDKIKCVVEEVEVTALERFIIPNKNFPVKLAFSKSLDKVCTTMCSGWFRDFAIDNYSEIISFNNKQKLNKIKGLLDGISY